MKHLIIFAHPNGQGSFNRSVLEAVVRSSQELNVETQVRDLYQLDFDPVISWAELQGANQGITPAEIRYEHHLIREADLITLVYPLWWMGFPAILKGYLDRVLSHGFAYKTEDGQSVGLLQGKKMQQFITLGSNVEKYQQLGIDKSLRDCLVDGLFDFCGISDIQHCFFGDIHIIDDNARQQMLDDAAKITMQNLTALCNAHNNVHSNDKETP
ncbi:NAD(P)H-dependent oxidoreductase [Avibacterium paragallinarum]|uniref:NAD(P)H-dependent oxidoreductase n=1 Tax=Avibacterium paragallinarum TaxID=728 RepID=UPI00102A64AF|nr:NAD(P)H-dependent oxidoreductase [Avibacterium paragallinarum]RZN56311.1 flavodoxin family protein [Avibacterium paragallinarum]TID11538.1 NAD(P)H oxidoreductase [Avibacterium paragallinarum]